MAESPPGSPLSSIASDDMSDRDGSKQGLSPSASNMPPSKRRRTGVASWDRNTPVSTSFQDDMPPPASPSSSISSDTSGDVPNSPGIMTLLGTGLDDDYSGQSYDQVTVCRWEGCDAHDLGDMDALVAHIHNDHVGSRQKKYSCEWIDCSRKGQTHASGYALRAHMRSHTREKPFYCALPECDRSFTRSDALAKHMRTVHETEALRPSDPVPKHHNVPLSTLTSTGGGPSTTPVSKLQRIKLKLSHPPKGEAGHHAATGPIEDLDEFEIPEFGREIGFDEHELELRPHDLYRLLRRQINWAEKESTNLREEWEKIRPKRKQAWLEKESAFDDAIDAELRLLSALVDGEGIPVPVAKDGDSFQQHQHQHQHQDQHDKESQQPQREHEHRSDSMEAEAKP